MVQKGKLDALAEANSSSENFVQVDIPHREACRMSCQHMHSMCVSVHCMMRAKTSEQLRASHASKMHKLPIDKCDSSLEKTSETLAMRVLLPTIAFFGTRPTG